MGQGFEGMKKLIENKLIEERILEIRGQKVMLDADAAEMYEYKTGDLNRKVNQKMDRFPSERYMFELSKEERKEIIEKHPRLEKIKFSPTPNKVFTEYGILMLATALNSDLAVQVSLQIVEVFLAMRNSLLTQEEANGSLLIRLDDLTKRLQVLEEENRLKEKIISTLENWKDFTDLRIDTLFETIAGLQNPENNRKIGF